MDGLRVASRKGLFTFRRANGGWSAGAPAFLGEPVTAVLTDPRDGAVYAALRLGHFGCKLHRSDDGVTWQERRIAGPFDLAVAPNANGLFVGDYMSLAGRGSEFLALFGATNNGNFANRTDIGLAFVGAAAGAAAKAGLDKNMYMAKSAPAMVIQGAIADRHDAAIRAAMQRRVAGWRSPREPVTKEDTR